MLLFQNKTLFQSPFLATEAPEMLFYRIDQCVSVIVDGNALTSNKGCSYKLMSYINEREKGRSILLPKPASDLVRSRHVGIHGTCAE